MLNSSSSITSSLREPDKTNAGIMMSIKRITFLSFCWYFSLSTDIIPLAIAPVRDTAPDGMLMGKLNVMNVATLDLPVATLSARTNV